MGWNRNYEAAVVQDGGTKVEFSVRLGINEKPNAIFMEWSPCVGVGALLTRSSC